MDKDRDKKLEGEISDQKVRPRPITKSPHGRGPSRKKRGRQEEGTKQRKFLNQGEHHPQYDPE